MNQTVSVAAKPSRKHRMLPVFVFLFVVSYGLLTMLVVLQDRMIDAQTDLIQLLFKESRRLTVMAAEHKIEARRNAQSAAGGAHPQSPFSQVQTPQAHSSATPKIGEPEVAVGESASQIPSSQKKAQASAKAGRSQRRARKASPFPPAEVTDPSDMRRTLFSI